MTQEQLAEKLKISRPFVCMLESGARDPSMKVFRGVVAILSEAVGERAAKRGWWDALPEENGNGE